MDRPRINRYFADPVAPLHVEHSDFASRRADDQFPFISSRRATQRPVLLVAWVRHVTNHFARVSVTDGNAPILTFHASNAARMRGETNSIEFVDRGQIARLRFPIAGQWGALQVDKAFDVIPGATSVRIDAPL